MLTLFVAAVLLRALPAVVSSDPSSTFGCNKKGVHDPKENQISWKYDGDMDIAPSIVPTEGHFHVWSLVSNVGDSLLKLSQDKDQLLIECSGSFSQNPAQFKDSTVYPTSSLSILFPTLRQKSYYLSIHHATKDVVVKDSKETLDDYDRLIPWLYRGFTMFESKSHPDNFLGCNKDGTVQLFYIRDKRHPDPRTLFVINNKSS